jgi:hypothetical protein
MIRDSVRLLGIAGLATGLTACAGAPAEAPRPSVPVGSELPVRLIPNVPKNAEAYYGPDSLHIIAQTQDPKAHKAEGRETGALTYTFTDQGTDVRRINEKGQDACS